MSRFLLALTLEEFEFVLNYFSRPTLEAPKSPEGGFCIDRFFNLRMSYR